MIEGRKHIVIAGAGVMGSSMAQLFAANGYQVILYDISEEAVIKSRDLIRTDQEAAIQAGELTEEERKEIEEHICSTCEKEFFK